MLDLVIVVAFLGLLAAAAVVARRLTPVVVATGLAVGVAGNVVQLSTALGFGWTARSLQALGLACALTVLVVAWTLRARSAHWRRSVLGVLAPTGLLALALTTLRLASDAAPLTAVGYLINHPQAEDNAKWLHLTSQLAQGSEVSFNGYAGGPLLLVLAMVAALVSALSSALLGGVNEVAVAANTVVLAQHLLIVLAPFSLTPLVEGRVRLARSRRLIPLPAVLTALVVLVVASAVVTSFGHLSLQWVLLVLVLWCSAFAAERGRGVVAGSTLIVVTAASVWVPLNVLALGLALAVIAWAVRLRDRRWVAVSAVAALACSDAVVSSVLFLVGIDFGAGSLLPSSGDPAAQPSPTPGESILSSAASLFTAPGGVEQVAPIVAVMAATAVVTAAWARRPRVRYSLLPVALLGSYLVAIQLADAVMTAAAPHYGGHKLAFAVTIAALCSTLPIAITSLGPERGMSGVRWAAVGAVIVLLALDTMLPRAVSALSPRLWPAKAAETPSYWSLAEVRPVADQPIASLPIACLFAPPGSEVPTALPLGQESYACTRILVGLAGLEGRAGGIDTWLAQDWLGQRPTWEDAAPRLAKLRPELLDRPVALMTPSGGTAGLTTLRALLTASPVPSP